VPDEVIVCSPALDRPVMAGSRAASRIGGSALALPSFCFRLM
jgi:hypothetical protein